MDICDASSFRSLWLKLQRSFIHNKQRYGNRGIDKENVVDTHSGILTSLRKGRKYVIHNDMMKTKDNT